MNRKALLTVILIAFFVGAVGSIVFGRFLIPYLSTFPKLSSLNKLVTTSPIVINRREEVQLNEGVNLIDLIKQAGNVTVGIYDDKNNFLGNGVIVTSDGLIMTTVIQAQTGVTVATSDGQKFAGTLKFKEPKTNLSIISIPASGLAAAQFDEAANLVAGQRVIFIGRSNAKFEHEALAGFVTQSLANQLGEKQISTDAVLSANYSGGPIINLSGRITGLLVSGSQNIIGENLKTVLNTYLANQK